MKAQSSTLALGLCAALAFGAPAFAQVALGGGSAVHPTDTAVGRTAEATGGGATAVGHAAKAKGDSSTALGADSQAAGERSTAVGQNAQATDALGTALGRARPPAARSRPPWAAWL